MAEVHHDESFHTPLYLRGAQTMIRILLLIICLTGSGCVLDVKSENRPPENQISWEYQQPEQVDDGWETSSLDSVGLDPDHFVTLMNTLHGWTDHLVHGILVIRHGKLVFEEYFDGLTHPTWGETPVTFNRDRLHVLSSVTKSFTSALLGVAINRSMISSADDSVFDFYPELAHLSTGQKQDISLRHLVTMSSGLEWDEWTLPLTDPNNDLTSYLNLALNTTEDLVAHVLGLNLVAIPGTVFTYSGGNCNVLGNAIQRASGMRLDAFAREYLFEPLGIEESWWWIWRPDFVYCSGDLALRPRDMARFGQLFLQNGSWNGEQIISEEWVARSAMPIFFFDHERHRGYSHGWWPCTTSYGQGAYSASGWGGQDIFILPEHDMLVIFTGGGYWEDQPLTTHEMMVDYILPAIRPE
ncbi:serine hydrolase domain-containing protein [Gemmatimonadota bacterium]